MTKVDMVQRTTAQQMLQQLQANPSSEDAPSFSETLKGMIDHVDELHSEAGQAVQDFIAGKNIQLHEVMAIGEEAQISFQFMLEVRNRILEAYQELSRTQI